MDFVALLDQMPASLPDLKKEISELQEDLENSGLEEEFEAEDQQAQADYEMYLESMEGE